MPFAANFAAASAGSLPRVPERPGVHPTWTAEPVQAGWVGPMDVVAVVISFPLGVFDSRNMRDYSAWDIVGRRLYASIPDFIHPDADY